MNSKEYVELCKKTESLSMDRVADRILHGVIGCGTEAGELLGVVKKTLFYGKELDKVNIIEELGDLSWYMSQLIDELGSSWEKVWDLNIKKLKKRYPHQFTNKDAANRDLEGERKVFAKRPGFS